MRLVLVGPPGSGKGTQAKLLKERLGLLVIGTGEILRDAIRRGTETGHLAEPYLKRGKLVPDDIVNELVADLFRRPDHPERFVMDGYPRTVAQAHAFEQILLQQHLNLEGVINLKIDDEEVVRRLSGRRYCPSNGATYHVTMRPPKVPDRDDTTGEPLVQRPDDREETIRARLEVFHQATDALIEHYRNVGKLFEISAHDPAETIYQSILQVVKACD